MLGSPRTQENEALAQNHNHKHCIKSALDTAEEVCKERGVRFTDLRRRILEMVWAGHSAVKAYDLLDVLSREGGSAKPPTVYRALDFLMEQGFVHKIESLNAYVGCPHASDEHISQFLICDSCGRVEEVTSDALTRELRNLAKSRSFASNRQTVEIHGHCANCG